MRGERIPFQTSKGKESGSSPLARGTGAVLRPAEARDRFIPACAGNGSTISAVLVSNAVHPRLRGERYRINSSERVACGSSPLARGTAGGAADLGADDRFIPACAGNGRSRPTRSHSRAVHPRLRGERPSPRAHMATTYGSSPLARGTEEHRGAGLQQVRFIPACAGNGGSGGTCGPRSTVHPRLRGERSRTAPGQSPTAGSSPLARGTVNRRPGYAGRHRFIPACAGNGRRCPRRPLHGPVHPRLRGERHPGGAWIGPVARFIPACAGNGRSGQKKGVEFPVHPRLRGERWRAFSHGSQHAGSSPLARGTAFRVRSGRDSRRFIPACAGNGGWR